MELTTLARLYEPFYGRLTQNDKFRFNLSNASLNGLVTNFLADFKPELTPLAFINYCAYQAWVWQDKELVNVPKLTHTMMLGKKARARYRLRDQANNWLCDQTLNDLKINRLKLLKAVEEQPYWDPRAVQDSEERERSRYLGQPLGFKHCLDFTSMYHPASPTCQQCPYRRDCRTIVRANFPVIARQRKLRREEILEKQALKALKIAKNGNPDAQRGLFDRTIPVLFAEPDFSGNCAGGSQIPMDARQTVQGAV